MDEWVDGEHTDEQFAYADFSEVDMRNCRFTRCSFHGADFGDATTTDCQFTALRLRLGQTERQRPHEHRVHQLLVPDGETLRRRVRRLQTRRRLL